MVPGQPLINDKSIVTTADGVSTVNAAVIAQQG